ncbi:hypothetical protein [Corynebacterium doosanense]|uniref:Uncharacterized protein n=1 Tax=Corynebacterium doosanense CAU 212 = DSM 45436 TaxID=558173 RepID=A0A097IH44_9CORY|nr:hypothetical protein [Corynebacterium doosanense]AIT61417.1 hypothetical protein CDOO_09185 [Corynebacterium doosanense CAU 212 = DSM 45436]
MSILASVAQNDSPSALTYLPVWLLFLLAGLLVGGAWSAYQGSSKVATILMAVLAALATAAALVILLGEIG